MQNICNKGRNPKTFHIICNFRRFFRVFKMKRPSARHRISILRNVDRTSEKMYNMLTNHVKETDRMDPESRSGRWAK